MSDSTKTAKQRAIEEKAKTLRRSWSQLPPVPKGWVRGRASIVSVDVKRTILGEHTTQIFAILQPKQTTGLLVELSGLTITPRLIRDNDMVEVFQGDATEQPLRALRVHFPLNDTWVDCYDGPGVSVRRHWVERVGSIAMVAGPILLIGTLIGLMWFYWRLFD